MCDQPSERNERISVLIVEDHPIFRDALRDHLGTRPDQFRVAGEAASREEALELVNDLVPDIVLLDLALPDTTEDGLQAIREIRAASPSTQVVVLTAFREDNIIFRAIQAGAVTYLLKDHATGQGVIESLLRVHAGDPPVDPEIARKLWNFFRDPQGAIAGRMSLDELTPRELDVLRLIADGKTNDGVAQQLFISVHTVKKHVSNILSKLQLHNRIELMIYYQATYSHLNVDTPSPSSPE